MRYENISKYRLEREGKEGTVLGPRILGAYYFSWKYFNWMERGPLSVFHTVTKRSESEYFKYFEALQYPHFIKQNIFKEMSKKSDFNVKWDSFLK